MSQRKCGNCGVPGHDKNHCPEPPRTPLSRSSSGGGGGGDSPSGASTPGSPSGDDASIASAGGLFTKIAAKQWEDVVSCITPELAAQQIEGKGVPLHVALKAKAPLEVLSALLVAFPDAVRIGGQVRNLPLHLATQFAAPLPFINELLAAYPQSVQEKNKDGQTPLRWSFDRKPTKEVLLTLLLADFPFPLDEQTIPALPREHAHSWTQIMDASLKVDEEKVLFIVEYCFNKWPLLAHQLAHVKDVSGRESKSMCYRSVSLLMNTYLLFYKRYELSGDVPIHKSATAIVQYAMDYTSDPPLRIALKFMKELSQFVREVSSRNESELDGRFVLDVIQSYDGDVLDESFSKGLARLGLSEYRYCLALPAADRSLKEIIDKERIAGGRNVEAVKYIATQLARALEHLHSKSRIHGDTKPLNIMRVGADIKLIDLDASALFTEHAASKWSSAYLPPELIAPDGSIKQGQVLAHASFDMWSFGCVLFQLCAGEPLWLANDEDNLDVHNKLLLHEWSNDLKLQKMQKISDRFARNLVSQLLNKEPLRRPASMAHVLAHPFLSGRTAGRLPGEEAEFDVFLSYRVDFDSAHVKQLYDLLVAKGVKVWWDTKCLQPGVSWEAGFCAGLVNSRCFVPLLSRAAIKSSFEALAQDSRCDNVLLEHRLAIELTDRGLLERVFPVMIGDVDAASGEYGDYFGQKCNPSASSEVVVRAVEDKLVEHLESQGLGLAFRESMSVKAVLDAICVNQGGFVRGSGGSQVLLEKQAEIIAAMVHSLDDLLGRGAGGAGGGGGGAKAQASFPAPKPHPILKGRNEGEASAIELSMTQELEVMRAQLRESEAARAAAEQDLKTLKRELSR